MADHASDEGTTRRAASPRRQCHRIACASSYRLPRPRRPPLLVARPDALLRERGHRRTRTGDWPHSHEGRRRFRGAGRWGGRRSNRQVRACTGFEASHCAQANPMGAGDRWGGCRSTLLRRSRLQRWLRGRRQRTRTACDWGPSGHSTIRVSAAEANALPGVRAMPIPFATGSCRSQRAAISGQSRGSKRRPQWVPSDRFHLARATSGRPRDREHMTPTRRRGHDAFDVPQPFG